MNNQIQYDKPFKTYAEQIEHLKNVYKLQIENDKFAEYALTNFSYYDLINGYKELFMPNGTFKQGVNIEYLTFFYLYDKEFQNLIFRYSLFIENKFKSALAQTLASSFGVAMDDYLANHHYSYSYKNKIFLHTVKNDIQKHTTKLLKDGTRIYLQQPTKHYSINHNHIPPWILVKNITFADSISLYKLLKTPQRQPIADVMVPHKISAQDKAAFLMPALDLIRNYRNVIAHNLKFTTYACPKYRLPLDVAKKIIRDKTVLDDIKKLDDVYACIFAIYTMLGNSFMAIQFLKDFFKIYYFQRDNNEIVNKALEQIRDDYFKITRINNNVHKLLIYSLGEIPVKSPFI